MKGYFIILIFITIVFILNNCNPEYECTAYVDPAVWDSLPNKFHDILTYNNENGNILKIYVGNLEMYAVKECDINDNCQCETHINYVQQRQWMDSEWLIYYNLCKYI
ncbi:MAG: hypothetical protein HY738_09580 [Bacteroidia bacterium]|nr:hypothetical protein [Bacteroidia bacterium]